MEAVDVEKVIRHEPDKDPEKPWALYTRDGKKLLGRHSSKDKALAQERAIWSNRRRRKYALIIGEKLRDAAMAAQRLLSFMR
jgi:hypothetical protein